MTALSFAIEEDTDPVIESAGVMIADDPFGESPATPEPLAPVPVMTTASPTLMIATEGPSVETVPIITETLQLILTEMSTESAPLTVEPLLTSFMITPEPLSEAIMTPPDVEDGS